MYEISPLLPLVQSDTGSRTHNPLVQAPIKSFGSHHSHMTCRKLINGNRVANMVRLGVARVQSVFHVCLNSTPTCCNCVTLQPETPTRYGVICTGVSYHMTSRAIGAKTFSPWLDLSLDRPVINGLQDSRVSGDLDAFPTGGK
jgi:hypothetical protein